MASESVDEEDLRSLVLSLRAEVHSALALSRPEERTLAQLAETWLPRKLRGMASSATFEGRVRLHILPALGRETWATLKVRTVEDFLHRLREGGLSPQTVNHVRDVGRQLVKDALRNGEWSGSNPFELAAKLEVPPPEFDVLTRPEASLLLRWGVRPELRPLFAVALYMGQRRGTIFGLRPEHVDLERKLIDFHVTKEGKKNLGVPIPEELAPHLKVALGAARGEWLFSQPGGKAMSPKSHILNDVLDEGLERAGIHRKQRALRLTFHGLRRSSSCLHQEAGCHPWVVSKVLGHSQASLSLFGGTLENMTARRYTQFAEQFIRVELNKLSLKS